MEFSNILKLVRSCDEQGELENIIASLHKNLYITGIQRGLDNYRTDFEKTAYEIIFSDINSKDIRDNSDIEKYLDVLLDTVKNLNKIKITIAISPNNHLLDALASWTEKNMRQKYIFDIEVDPQILGGAIISSKKGVYKDFSLSRKINDIFTIHKKEIFSQI